MSATLERRTAKLERAAYPDGDHIDTIFRRIIRTVGDEIVRAVIGDRILERGANETEDAFMERAKAEALAGTDRRPCRVLLLPEEH